MSLAQKIITAIQNAIGTQSAALHEPSFSGNESKYVQECIDSTFVSSVGKFVDRFEKEIADYTGSKHAVVVVNGTAALHSGTASVQKVQVPVVLGWNLYQHFGSKQYIPWTPPVNTESSPPGVCT